MNQNLKIKRIYNLGNYSNVEFTEEVNDIPEGLVYNKEVMYKVRKLMILNIERQYRSYLETLKESEEDQDYLKDQLVDDLEQLDKENN